MADQADAAPGFENDIRPLFTDVDVEHMEDQVGFDLCDYDNMKSNAQTVYKRLTDPNRPMPPKDSGGPWPQSQIDLFQAWIAGGCQP